MQNITFRHNALALALFAALMVPCAAFAQSTPSGQDQAASGQATGPTSQKKTLQEVTVLGSRIPRTEIEGAAPVQIVTGVQIKAQGYTTLYQFLQSLPQTSGNSDFGSRPTTWGSTAVNARPVDLRGLGPQYTLLLIDGHRVVDYPQPQNQWFGHYSFQNAANIPTGMIDRVEVLATGASAIYGSDAMTGVVNVILKKNYQGDDLTLQMGGDTRGGQQFGDFTWTGGRSGDKWNIVYNFEHTNRAALWGKDRPWTDSEADAGYGTWGPSARMFGYHTYDAISLYDANGNYITPPAGSCGQFQNFSLAHYQTIATNGDQVTGPVTDQGYYCTQHDLFRNWVLAPGFLANNFYIRGDYEINPNLDVYGSVAMYNTTGWSQTQRPFAYPMGGLPVPFYDQGSGQIITNYLRQLTAAEMGGQGNTYDREKYWDIRVGVKGGIMDDRFSWDLEFGSQKYLVHEDYTGLNEQGMFDFFFGPQLGTTTINGTTYPVYDINQQRYWNPITPAEYSTFGVAGTNSSSSWRDNASLSVNGDLFHMPWNDKAVGWAAVLEADHQGYGLNPDARGNTLNFGDPFQDYNTGGGTRTHYAFGTEFRVPILSTLTWDIAGRIDKYNDASIADIARTWNTGIEWRPIKGLLLRGTYGTNFKAPGMDAIYMAQSATTVGIYADPLQCIQTHDTNCQATQHSTYFTLYSGGNPNLLPLTGHSWTYGFVWDIPHVDGLSVSSDFWHETINNEIEFIGMDQILTDEAGCLTGLQVSGAPYTAHVPGSTYCQDAIADVQRDGAGNITAIHTGPINESYQSISGVDTSVDYAWQTENWGSFKFQLHWTDNLKWESRTLPTDPLINTRNQRVQSRMTASLDWSRGPWNATLYGLRWGGVEQQNYNGCEVLPNGIQPSVGDPNCVIFKGNYQPWIIYSGSVGYQFDKRLKMTLTVNNIFDRVGTIGYYSGGFEFIPTSQGADYTGRQVFLTINYKLD